MSDVSAPLGTSTSLLLMKKYSCELFFQCRYAYGGVGRRLVAMLAYLYSRSGGATEDVHCEGARHSGMSSHMMLLYFRKQSL